jgi:hypothetical protein
LDIAPQEAVKVVVNPSDTPSGISINLPYIVTDRSWMYDPLNKTLMSNLTGQILTNGSIGETIIIPDIPPDDGYAGKPFFPIGALPPPLLGLGGATFWQGSGYFVSAGEEFNTALLITGTVAAFGEIYPLSTYPATSGPQILNPGWYNINIDFTYESAGNSIIAYNIVGGGGILHHALDYFTVTSYGTDTRTFHTSMYGYFSTGNRLDMSHVAGSSGWGRFVATLSRVGP